MNKKELGIALKENKIREDMYNLDGGLPNEAYCLSQDGTEWQVYYSERGLKSGLVVFSNENDACKYLYDLLLNENHKHI